jgi:hypothetical protein
MKRFIAILSALLTGAASLAIFAVGTGAVEAGHQLN